MPASVRWSPNATTSGGVEAAVGGEPLRVRPPCRSPGAASSTNALPASVVDASGPASSAATTRSCSRSAAGSRASSFVIGSVHSRGSQGCRSPPAAATSPGSAAPRRPARCRSGARTPSRRRCRGTARAARARGGGRSPPRRGVCVTIALVVEVVDDRPVGADRQAADACLRGQGPRAARRARGRHDDLDAGRPRRGDRRLRAMDTVWSERSSVPSRSIATSRGEATRVVYPKNVWATSSSAGSTPRTSAQASASGTPTTSRAAQRGHLAEPPRGGEVDGGDAEARREHAVERGRGAAALQVPEHGHPRLEPGQPLELGAEARSRRPRAARSRRRRPRR